MAAAAGEKWASRVIIQMPPRHGKSEFCSSYFPSWYIGMHPDDPVILASYADTLAAGFGQRNRDLLDAHGLDLFGIRVRGDSSAKANWRIHRRRGGMFTTGLGGPLTGKGAKAMIIDDPVKNAEEALSPTYRERAKEWYASTARTRLEPGGFIVIIQTRWHDDDLAGYLQSKEGGEWLVISLPAIADDDELVYLPDDPTTPAWTRSAGEALWPWRYDLNALLTIREELGGPDSHWWTALYQQRPTPIGGGVLKPGDFRRYDRVDGGYLLDTPAGPQLVPANGLNKFVTMDLATSLTTQADYTAIAVAGLRFPDLILLDMLRGRLEGPDLAKIAARVYQAYEPAYLGVESTGFQLSVVQDMRRGAPWESPPRPALPVKALRPRGDKIGRALTLAAQMGAGRVYAPREAPWLAALEAELALFPKGTHDDQVDALAYAALEINSYGDNIVRGA
jgi:predicted phage terminase large subunit-like protein